MKKGILLIIIIITLGTGLNAQIKLIPTPQRIDIKSSDFKLEQTTEIVINNLDPFYGNELLNYIQQELDFQLKLVQKSNGSSIELLKTSKKEELKNVLTINNLDTTFHTGTEGYVLDISPKTISIIAQTDAGIFYGIQTLKQIIAANQIGDNIPCLTIYDYPNIPVRAWQDDISRGPIPTMELLKEQIQKMASYKLNYIYLYIEHVFKLEKHPGIAPDDGISKAQIIELSQYAKQYHVQLIGGYQSFGHMAKTLSHPDYQHLAENEHIISPALDESYEFLEDVYDEIVPVFNSEYFNINCDETFGLGEGKSKEMVDSMGIDGVYIYHITKLNNILEKYDKKILMWGDIISGYPNTVKQLPEDITVLAWGYHAADSFDYAITPISASGFNFWVAPGINCWSNIFPNFHETEINVYNFIRDGYKLNASGVLNTSWDDDGLNFFNNNWHGLIWGAEISWKTPSYNNDAEYSQKERSARYKSFNDAYDRLFYGLKNESLTEIIVEFSRLHQSGTRDILKNSRFFEPIFPIHQEYITDERREENLELLSQIDELNKRIQTIEPNIKNNSITVDYLKFAIRQVRFTLNKNLLRQDLYHYIQGSKNLTISELQSKIDELIFEANLLKKEYSLLWDKENRHNWVEINLQKFDNLINGISNLKGYCIISPDNKISEKGRKIHIRSLFGDLPVYYSINEDTVGNFSNKYSKDFFINEDAHIKARVINNDKAYDISEIDLIYHKGVGRLYNLNSDYSTYHPSYDGGGIYALLDGKQGEAENLRSGKWQGFSGQNINIEIDLEKEQSFSSFSMGFYQNTHSWVIFPKKVEIFIKNDNDDEYLLLKTITNSITPKTKGKLRQDFNAEFQNIKTRYIKVVAHYYGKLPEWHHAGSQYESMIFSDEIIII